MCWLCKGLSTSIPRWLTPMIIYTIAHPSLLLMRLPSSTVRLMPTQELVRYMWLTGTHTIIWHNDNASDWCRYDYPLRRLPCKWKLASLGSSNNNPQRHRKNSYEDKRPPIPCRSLCVHCMDISILNHMVLHTFLGEESHFHAVVV